MKKILSTALAIALFVGAAQAQDEGNRKQGGKHGDMYKELNLTADQQAKIKSIREAEKTEMQALKADGKTEADKAARKELHAKYKTQLDAVLTADQKAKLKDAKKEHRDEPMGKGSRKDKRQEFGKNLDLSADQKTKMATVNSEFKAKMDAVKNNTALSATDKKEQAKQLAEAHKANLKAILTKEQVTKMEAAKEAHKNKKNVNL